MASQAVPAKSVKTHGPVKEITGGIFLAIACVLVSLRFYVRARMVKKLWWDDLLLLLGLLFFIIELGLEFVGVTSRPSRQSYSLSPEEMFFAMKMLIISLPFFLLSLMFTKLSILLLLKRMFMTSRVSNYRVWKRAIYISMALMVVTSLSSIMALFIQCKPVAKLWNPTISGTCWSRKTQLALYCYQGGVSIFTDFLLALLPSYFLKDLQISLRTKLSICALMSLGVFTGICAINRTAVSPKMYPGDPTYESIKLKFWGGLEPNIAIIAAAIPALRPLWAKCATQNNRGPIRRSNDEQRLSSTYDMMNQPAEADSFLSRLETCVTAQGGQNRDVENEATSLPDCKGIAKPSHVSPTTSREREEKS